MISTMIHLVFIRDFLSLLFLLLLTGHLLNDQHTCFAIRVFKGKFNMLYFSFLLRIKQKCRNADSS
jgi:hypothetical protein